MELFKEIEFILQMNVTLFTIFFFILGCCFGSFFNVVILRYPHMVEGENAREIQAWFEEKGIKFPDELLPLLKSFNISFPASHCSSCKTPLKWYHNIPFLSYLFLKGKCGFCKSHISIQYPIVELIGGIILAMSFKFLIGLGLIYFISYSLIFLILFLLIGIDLKSFLLPDSLNYFILWFGLLLSLNHISLLRIDISQSIYGAITGYLILFSFALFGKFAFKKEAMGNGDFKLIAALGTLLGIKGAVFTIFSSPFLGIITYILLKVFKKGDSQIPYGPSLILCGMLYLIWGNEIMSYLNLS